MLSARTRAALARELADGPDLDLPRARALGGAAVAAAGVTGDPATLAFCLFAQHDVEWAPGTAQRRLALADRMAQAAARGGDQELEFQAGLCRYVALLELIDPAAEAALAQLEDLAQRTGQPRLTYLAASRRAAYTLLTGPVAEAERQINAAAELADTLGEPDGFGVRATQLIALGLARGGVAGVGAMLRSFDPVGDDAAGVRGPGNERSGGWPTATRLPRPPCCGPRRAQRTRRCSGGGRWPQPRSMSSSRWPRVCLS